MPTAYRLISCWFLLTVIGCIAGRQAVLAQLMPRLIQTFTSKSGINFTGNGISRDQTQLLWFATDDGIVNYDGRRFRVLHDPLRRKNDDFLQAVSSVDGKVWLNPGYSRSLAYVDTKRQQIIRIPDSARVVRDYLVKYTMDCLFPDSHGVLWIGLMENGMIRVDPNTLAVEHVFTENVRVWDINETADGRIWLATAHGLYAYHPITKQLRVFRNDPLNTNSISSNDVRNVHVRRNGQLMIGMPDVLDIFDPVKEQFQRFPLIKNHVDRSLGPYSFSTDPQGNDYFCTWYAAYRYNERDGLQRLEFPYYSDRFDWVFADHMNHLWTGSPNELNLYSLNEIQPLPSVSLVDVKVNGTRLNERAENHRLRRDSLGRVSITILENESLEIHYALSSKRQRNRARHKLVPYSEDWLTREEQSSVASYQLPPGHYTFWVSPSRNNGTWNDPVKVMDIDVKPLFYNIWWVRLAAILFVFGGGYFLIHTYLRRQRIQRELIIEKLEATNLRKLDELKSQFFANVTHEFRTPLTLILHAAEQLATRSTDAWGKERLTTIKRNADQLTRLIIEMLDISRMDAHKLEIHTKVGDPTAFIHEQVQGFAEMAVKKNIALSISLPTESTEQTYLFDDDKLGKITYNLVSNALKFTAEGGSVSVSSEVLGDSQLKLMVQDTGIGIAADQVSRIFERFYQADNSLTRKYEGTGIGLAYVKELTELMGGQVSVDSAVGKGSTFTVQLPIKSVIDNSVEPLRSANLLELVSQPDSSDSVAMDASSDKPIILVVEDNNELCTYVGEHLRSDYQVIEAVDGQEGVNQALTIIPDLILSDVMMPKLDGYELISTLKNDDRTSHIPIIILSAKASFESKMSGLTLGADDYLSKPFELSELTTRIHNILAMRRRWQQYLTRNSSQSESQPSLAASTPLPDREKQFIERLRQLVLDRLTEEVDVDTLVTHSRMSRAQLHRKLTALTNLSTTGFINSIRLEKACELLQSDNLTVAEVAYRVGYSSPPYFSKVFSEHFGYPPGSLKI